MRILLVNYRYFISGGPEKYMFHVKKILEDHGHEVIPFSIHSNQNFETEYSKYFVEPIGGRDAVYYEDYKKTPKTIWQMFTRSVYSFQVKRALKREIADVKPDIVYTIHFINKLSPSVLKGAKEMGVPVVSRLSDYFMLCPRFDFMRDKKVCEDCLTKGYRSCIKYRCVKGSFPSSLIRVFSMKVHNFLHVYDNVDAFVTPSEFLRDKLIANGYPSEKIYCIPTFTMSSQETMSPVIGNYALYFGRIDEEKGVETAVKAYEKMPDAKLKVMGNENTEEGKKLISYVREHNLRNIEFVGYKTGEELEEVINGARFTLIPSLWYDNLPNTALESFQHSKPVIASNIGSLPELVINGENGYLFNPGDVDDLISKIQMLRDDEKVAEMGIKSKARLEDLYAPERHYDSLIKLFESLI